MFKVPPFYTQVLAFVSLDNSISTPLLYKILESSHLSNATLGAIWALCNQVFNRVLIGQNCSNFYSH